MFSICDNIDKCLDRRRGHRLAPGHGELHACSSLAQRPKLNFGETELLRDRRNDRYANTGSYKAYLRFEW